MVRKCTVDGEFSREYLAQATKLARLGLTDKEMAKFFEVSFSTFCRWLRRYPELRRAMREGKDLSDADVATSLYKRAIGYEHEAVKIVINQRTGEEYVVPYTKRYPPDTLACMFWLRNRQRDKWTATPEDGAIGDDDPDTLNVNFEVVPAVKQVRVTRGSK